MTTRDDDLSVRPGRIRHGNQGAKRPKSFVGEVMRAAKKAGHTGRSFGRSGGTKGRSTFGRGRRAALSLSSRSPGRRVVIMTRIVRHQGTKFRSAPLSKHVTYLKREGVTRDGIDARMFDATSDEADAKAFAEAAVRSDCPTGAQGGSLGQIRRGELAPPVQAALEALAEGSTAREPIRSRFGWHVVRLARRIEGRELPYEIVADKIRDLLEARAWSIGAAQYVAQLASQAQIEGVEITPPDAGFASCEEGKGC